MKQLFETYKDNAKLQALLKKLSWTNHCIIMAQCKTLEEKEFYIQTAAKAGWSKRELETQIKRSTYERIVIADKKLSPVVRELPQDASKIFKDSYLLDFIDLPEPYIEEDLQFLLPTQLTQLTYLTQLKPKVVIKLGLARKKFNPRCFKGLR